MGSPRPPAPPAKAVHWSASMCTKKLAINAALLTAVKRPKKDPLLSGRGPRGPRAHSAPDRSGADPRRGPRALRSARESPRLPRPPLLPLPRRLCLLQLAQLRHKVLLDLCVQEGRRQERAGKQGWVSLMANWKARRPRASIRARRGERSPVTPARPAPLSEGNNARPEMCRWAVLGTRARPCRPSPAWPSPWPWSRACLRARPEPCCPPCLEGLGVAGGDAGARGRTWGVAAHGRQERRRRPAGWPLALVAPSQGAAELRRVLQPPFRPGNAPRSPTPRSGRPPFSAISFDILWE